MFFDDDEWQTGINWQDGQTGSWRLTKQTAGSRGPSGECGISVLLVLCTAGERVSRLLATRRRGASRFLITYQQPHPLFG